jgi:C1A family cysteine protease
MEDESITRNNHQIIDLRSLKLDDNYCLGCIPSEDESDSSSSNEHIAGLTDTVPDEYTLIPYLEPIRDQGRRKMCVAYAVACMKEYQTRRDHNRRGYISVDYIYDLRSNGGQHGMKIRDALRIVMTHGALLENEYTNGAFCIDRKAQKRKITGFIKINNITDLKRAIMENGPCPISFPVYHFHDRIWEPQNTSQQLLGYHAMAVVGWSIESFILRNSWGTTWSNNGYQNYPYTNWGSHNELWTAFSSNSKMDCYIC